MLIKKQELEKVYSTRVGWVLEFCARTRRSMQLLDYGYVAQHVSEVQGDLMCRVDACSTTYRLVTQWPVNKMPWI